MKRILKRFMPQTILLVLVAVFAVAEVSVFAAVNGSTDNKVDLSLVMTPETQLTVNVDGQYSGALSESYGFGDTATITAPEVSGKTFSHWEADGSVISYEKELKLTMNAHTTLYAVYANEAPTTSAVAGFTSITRTNEGDKISFQAIAGGSTVDGAGIVYSTTAIGENLKIGGTSVTAVAAERLTDGTTKLPESILDENNCWMLQIKPTGSSTVYHARAYVTVGGNTTYGDVKDVKLSELESGISMIANLEGFEPGTDDLLEEIAKNRANNPASVTNAPTAKNLNYNGQAQALVTTGTASGGEMQYALGTDATTAPANNLYTTSIPTGTDAGTYYVWYKVAGDGNHSDSVPAYVTSTIRGEISQTVTFKVVNGSWNDGTTADKTVNLNGYEGDTLKLAATDIPAVGNKPGAVYKVGSWDVTPDTKTAITTATTYTYTYAQKDSNSHTVTFKVVNGSWDDGTTADKTVILNGYEGDTLKLTATDIPAVGNKPGDVYKVGSWDVTPDTKTAITAATTYIYTYVHKESTEGEVTFNKGEDDAETPKTVVESVESSDLTEFAETQKEEGKEVKVELEITPKKEADIVQTSVDGTKQIAKGLFVGFDTEKVVTEYFDIDLTKYVDEVKQDNISDTVSPIEIALKYDKTKMFDPVVVRTHKGKTVEFSKLNARPAKADYKDATYYVGDGVIYIYSQYFSDYAIIYSTVKTYNVDIVTGTGDKISKTVAEGSKAGLPTGLSKSGYTFSGWYSDEACTKVWKEDDAVTADITIYAKWTKDPAPTQVPTTVPTSAPTPVPTSAPVTTPTATPTPTVAPTVTPAPVKDSITAEEAARGAIKLNAGLKVYPKNSDVVVKWGKVDNADRYVIYAAYCKKGRKCAKIATLDGDVNSYKFSELNGKAINTRKNIKLYVVAYRKVNGKYKKITSSITAHIVGSGSKKYSNVKGINVESTKITLSLDDNTAAPSSYTLNPVAVLKDSSKKMLLHTAEFRYATSKSSVATVGKDGTITAKGKGTCYIYVYAQNGYAKKIKVTVK